MKKIKIKRIWEEDYNEFKCLVGKKTKNDRELFKEIKELAYKGKELDVTKKKLDNIGRGLWGKKWDDWFG